MKQKPYLKKKIVKIVRKWNPNYDQDAECECGHPYYRHFDTYEDMRITGCKYCGCYPFKLKEK